jgi:hypothetical protein
MANTTEYNRAEDYIREKALKDQFGQTFVKKRLIVGKKADGTYADHEFDAVSSDGKIVTSIKAHSGRTSGKKNPVGKIMSTFTEVLFLSLVQEGEKKYLILTDPEFYNIFRQKADGKLPIGIQILHLPLPPEVQEQVNKDKEKASSEMTGH